MYIYIYFKFHHQMKISWWFLKKKMLEKAIASELLKITTIQEVLKNCNQLQTLLVSIIIKTHFRK